jgi:hypothetical protein
MKKFTLLSIIGLLVFGLTACTTESTSNEVDTETIGSQLATSIYLSQGLLESDNVMTTTRFMFLSTTEGTEVESRMDQMMRYFERINIFIGSDPNDALDINVDESTLDEFESQVSYKVESTTYTIHYNIVDVIENDDLNEQEFSIEGILEYGATTLEITGGTELEEGEVEMFFETHETDNDDYVRVEIEKSEAEQYFEIETSTNGKETYSELRLEKDGVDGAIEIYIEENGLDTYYEITKEIDGEFTIYYFEYSIGDTSGSIQLTEYSIDGQEVQHFIIEEDDFYKEYTVPSNMISPDDL